MYFYQVVGMKEIHEVADWIVKAHGGEKDYFGPKRFISCPKLIPVTRWWHCPEVPDDLLEQELRYEQSKKRKGS